VTLLAHSNKVLETEKNRRGMDPSSFRKCNAVQSEQNLRSIQSTSQTINNHVGHKIKINPTTSLTMMKQIVLLILVMHRACAANVCLMMYWLAGMFRL